MKKTRKALSVILSLLVVMGSLPVVYTTAADAVAYAADGEGSIDNPTHPVSAEGAFSYDDLYKLNIDVENTSYTFYQTRNDEYFTFTQILGLQQKNDVPTSGRTFNFVGVDHYAGATGATSVNSDGYGEGTDLMEVPSVTENTTTDFLNTYYVSHTWSAINSNASELSSAPLNVQLQGSVVDLTGCKNYSWQDKYVIKGHSASQSGEVNTGYYEAYNWNWSTSDASAAYELRLKTSIRILDARELANEIAEAEAILANPDGYTDAYISSVEATLNTIPDDLRDFSAVYSQSEIDKYTEMLVDVSLNSADYTEYNQVYKSLKSITNAKGAYTAESFEEFKAKIASINANLPKNLDKTQQSTVDAATQALRDAYELLVEKGEASGSTYTETTQDIKFTVQNEFNFIQIEDDQELSYTQFWSIDRRDLDSKDSRRMFYSVVDSSDAFTSRFVDASVDTVSSLSANAIEDSLSNALIFTCWEEMLEDGSVNPSTEVIDRTTHTIDGSYSGFEKDKAYYIENTPVFTGLSASETGAHTFTYDQTIYLNWQQNYVVYTRNNYSQTSFTTTVNITDARALVKAIEQANETIANPGTHTEAYIEALKAAVSEAPTEMLRGVEYYTQEEVDAVYNSITSVSEDCADYSEFNELFAELSALEKSSEYTDESYEALMDAIYEINRNLPKNLTADQQATVDEATQALHEASHLLVYYKLNSDNVFTDEDIPETLGNSPLSFSLSSTYYEFMQVSDGQQFAIRTDFSAKNTDSSYTLNLLSLGFSTVTEDTKATICDARSDPDEGCHNASGVPATVDGYTFFDLATYAGSSDTITGITSYTADDAGDTGEFNTWVNTDGTALSSGGILTDGVELSLSDSTGYATYTYTTPTDPSSSGEVNIYYAFRLGWSYSQFWGDSIRRHVHIPVYLRITDARQLHSLYNEVAEILEGNTDANYTFDSLVNLYNVFNTVPADMANGETYYTQAEVMEQYEILNAAKNALVEGADYSEYFKAYTEALEIINTGNDDGYGNKIYDDATYNKLVDKVTSINDGLQKDLTATDENQATIDYATLQIREAIDAANATKYADYTALEEAIIEANKIASADEGTYTEESLSNLTSILEQAESLDRTLSVSEQATVDALTSQLETAIADMEYKADYSEFEDAYSQVQDIVNNPDNYTSATVEAAQNALAQADELDKDLADTAENRQTIEDATSALQSVIDNAQAKADYTEFDEVVDALEEIVNAPEGTYTDETVQKAQDALDSITDEIKDLPASEQATLDEFVSNLQAVVDSAEKKADYTDYNNAKSEADSLVNDDGNGNAIYNEDAFNAYKEAVEAVDTALDKDLAAGEQATVDEATQSLADLKATLENNKNADYTEFDEAKAALEEIVNAPEGTYTDETVQNAQTALDAANQVPSDMVVGENNANQEIIDNATDAMQSVIASAEKKADYTDFNTVVDALEEIVNAPEGTYTDETVQKAQDALDNIVSGVDTDLPESEQATLDEITAGLQDIVDSAEKKADYTDFNTVVDALEEIVNNPDNYTEETVQKAQDALDNIVSGVDTDLPESEQATLDEITAGLQEIVDSAEKKADYTDYNNAKSEADSLVNDDGNGNPIYDEDAFNAYKEAVEAVDSALSKELPESQQSVVDEATTTLEDLKLALEEKKIYTVTFIDLDGETLSTVEYVNGSVFGTVTAPALPESTETTAYVGWLNGDVFMQADTVMNGDVTLTIASELHKIIAKDSSEVVVDSEGEYATGIDKSTTAAELKAELQNDETVVEIRHFDGTELESESLVGTGSTITLKSKYTGVVYETRTIIIYGDLDGDGDVDADDFALGKVAAVADDSHYSEEQEVFFLANDVNGDGYIDAIDSWIIGRIQKGKMTVLAV